MRRQRIEYDGAMYHVIQRSNNREMIFGSDSDKQLLLELLAGQRRKMRFSLLGYVIMDNHYHLLLQTGSIPLSEIMHRINYLYSRYYNHNRSYKRQGHVFGGRYKAGLVQSEGYLFAILRYIHQNPVRAGICENVSDFSWSSDAAYRHNDHNNKLVNIDFILNILAADRTSAIKAYRQLMGEAETVDYEKINIIGDDEFVKAHTADGLTEAENSNFSLKQKRKILEEIINECGASTQEIAQIRSGSRKRNLTPYKKLFALKAVEEGFTQKQIGEFIKVSDAAINKLIS